MISKVDNAAKFVSLDDKIDYYVQKVIEKDFNTPNYLLSEAHMQQL